MADLTPRQGESIDGTIRARYRDMGDGTHAIVVAIGPIPAGAANIGDVDVISLPAGNLGQRAMAASLSIVPASDITDQTYIGDVRTGGRQNELVQTPTITAGAYTSGDALGGLLTFANAALAVGRGGTITKVVIIDDDDELQPIDLVLFNQTFTPTADNSAFAPSDADLKNCLGHISIAATDYASFNDNAVATKRNVGFDYLLAGTSLFGQMVIRDVGGYAATDDITVVLSIRYD